jgi:hypothetical protein
MMIDEWKIGNNFEWNFCGLIEALSYHLHAEGAEESHEKFFTANVLVEIWTNTS